MPADLLAKSGRASDSFRYGTPRRRPRVHPLGCTPGTIDPVRIRRHHQTIPSHATLVANMHDRACATLASCPHCNPARGFWGLRGRIKHYKGELWHACMQTNHFPIGADTAACALLPLEPTPSMDRAAGIALQKEPAWACTDLSNSDAPMCGSLSGSRYGNRSKFEVPRLGSIPDPELSDLEMLHDVGALPGQGADRGRRVRPDFYKPVRQPEIFERIADLSSLMAGLHSRVGLRLS